MRCLGLQPKFCAVKAFSAECRHAVPENGFNLSAHIADSNGSSTEGGNHSVSTMEIATEHTLDSGWKTNAERYFIKFFAGKRER